jgi:hypothetical protein
LEHPEPQCSSKSDTDYLAIKLYSAGGGTAGDVIEFMTNGYATEYWQNPYSVTAPAADTSNAGAMSVGAIDPVDGSTIAIYSSRGPTNDGRTKPNLSAASNMSSYTYSSQGGFAGTSASTPVTAGAAALVLQAYPGTGPSALMSYLQNSAVVDRGVAGPDNTYGAGELLLPSPPTSDTIPPTVSAPKVKTRVGSQLSSTVSTTISWGASDPSGIQKYELWVSTNGGSYVQQTLSSATQTSINVLLNPGTTYRYAVRARDSAGNWSDYAYGPKFTQTVIDDDASSISYGTGWTRYARNYAYGGHSTFTRTNGSNAKLTFTGRGVAWVATRADTQGQARVFIDGIDQGLVDLYQSSLAGKQVAFSYRWAGSGSHTIKVVGQGTSGRPWVDVDAFVVTQ